LYDEVVENFAVQAIRKTPKAPRDVADFPFTAVFADRMWFFVFLFGVGVILAGIYAIFRPWGNPIIQNIVISIAFATGLLISLGPIIYAIQLCITLRNGLLTTAVIKKIGDGTRPTFIGIETGSVDVEWEILLPEKNLVETKTLERKWIRQLKIGSRVRVIAHTSFPKTTFPLGPEAS
jgi:hypothetical protein